MKIGLLCSSFMQEYMGHAKPKPGLTWDSLRVIQTYTGVVTSKSVIFFGRYFFHSPTRNVSSVNYKKGRGREEEIVDENT